MIFQPQQYCLPDRPHEPFIDAEEIQDILNSVRPDRQQVETVIAKSLSKQRLSLRETAVLLNAEDEESIRKIREGARWLKETIYGKRIVLFAPLYIGNKCANNCLYCGFRASNTNAVRKTLSDEEIIREIEALEDHGQKRLILVFGEHEQYDAEYIAHCVKLAYRVKKGNGEIRRVNINAAPMDQEGFRIVREARIGTYQIFQETYHPEAYHTYHLRGKKADYHYRLTAFDRAMEAGIDDVGIGALFGLYDWKFEVLGLIRHVNHLEACFGVGPHTISFPRIKDASMLQMCTRYFMTDEDFTRMIAIMRLAVPYTGMILTAREPVVIRNEALQYGVSQIDGGTKLELGAYAKNLNEKQDLNRGQFRINDSRSLNEVIEELIAQELLPSFCTACYRLERTGEHFMEFSVPGFIKRFCTPNAILTFAEYLCDYAPQETAGKGWALIEKEIEKTEDPSVRALLIQRIQQIHSGRRDLYF